MRDAIQPCVHYFLRNFLFLISVSHTTCPNILRGVIIVKTLIQPDATQNKAEHTNQSEVTNTKGYTLLLLPNWNRSLPLAQAGVLTSNGPLFLPSISFPVHDFVSFNLHFFTRSRKATISFVTYVYLSVCLSVRSHETNGLPHVGFSWNFVFNIFLKSLEKIQVHYNVTSVTGTLP